MDTSSQGGESEELNTITMHAPVGSIDSLGLVYILAGVVLLGLVGAAISRPDLAARIRLPVLGFAGGLLAIVVALTLQLPEAKTAAQLGIGFNLPREFRDRITSEVQPGLYFAYAAVLLPVLAVFLAAKPITRTQAEGPTDVTEEQDGVQESRWVPVRAEGATGLTVSAADPRDRHTGTDVWRPS